MTYIANKDFKMEVARGAVPGWSLWNKFGYNRDVDSAAPEQITSWGGAFQRLTEERTLDVYSDSGNDSSAGTGAQQVILYGVAWDWTEQIG